MASASELLAHFVAGTRLASVPRSISDKTKLHVLDTISLSIVGWFRLRKLLEPLAASLKSKGNSFIFGLQEKAGPEFAALLNSISAHSTELDDEHRASMTHVGAAVVPAALAAAQSSESDGETLLCAVLVGYEVAVRVGLATGAKGVYARGFHPSSICACLGSAAAAAKALGLDKTRTEHAIGLAAVQSSGMMEGVETGPSSWYFQYGRAAQSGVLAAFLAMAGFTAPETILDGEKGLVSIFSNEPSKEFLSNNLGQSFAIGEVGFKPYACCRSIHPALGALTILMSQHSIRPESVETIDLFFPRTVYPLVSNPPDISMPMLSLQQSASFCLASYMFSGRLLLEEFDQEKRARPEVGKLARKMRVHIDERLDSMVPRLMPARVSISTISGEKFEEEQLVPLGDPENPMTAEQVKSKALGILGSAITDPAQIHNFLKRILDLEKETALDFFEITSQR